MRTCPTSFRFARRRAGLRGSSGGFAVTPGECGVGLVLLLVSLAGASVSSDGSAREVGSQPAFLDVDAILAGWRSSYEGIEPLRVAYFRRLVDYRPPDGDANPPTPVRYMYIERMEDGTRYHLRHFQSEGPVGQSDLEYAFDGTITREYRGGHREGVIRRGLTGRHTERKNHIRDLMLLNRQHVAAYRDEYPNGVPTFVFLLRPLKSTAVVRSHLERVASQACHVVELSDVGPDYENKSILWVAHERGMCLMKYEDYGNDYVRGIDVQEIGRALTDTREIWYPVRFSETVATEENGSWKVELAVREFRPNVPVDANTFTFTFPDGTRVVDDVLGISYVVGATDIEPAAEGDQTGSADTTQRTVSGEAPGHDEASARSTRALSPAMMDRAQAVDESPEGPGSTGHRLLVIGGLLLLSAGALAAVMLSFRRSGAEH